MDWVCLFIEEWGLPTTSREGNLEPFPKLSPMTVLAWQARP